MTSFYVIITPTQFQLSDSTLYQNLFKSHYISELKSEGNSVQFFVSLVARHVRKSLNVVNFTLSLSLSIPSIRPVSSAVFGNGRNSLSLIQFRVRTRLDSDTDYFYLIFHLKWELDFCYKRKKNSEQTQQKIDKLLEF